MTHFQLDTSGRVEMDETEAFATYYEWRDLDSFTQGYVEAMFAGAGKEPGTLPGNGPGADGQQHDIEVGFSDLAPETLARIVEDCTRFVTAHVADGFSDEQAGRDFCAARPGGWHDALGAIPDFPPLSAYLGDDGKVYLRESTQ